MIAAGIPHNKDLNAQIYFLERIAEQSEVIRNILRLAPGLRMPNWYLGAGCIAQTVWNVQHGFDLTHGIKDYDLVYYDPSDISYKGEEFYIRACLRSLLMVCQAGHILTTF